MIEPPSRITQQKVAPCGAAGSEKGPVVATYQAGQTITVSWEETVNHPSHYRIALGVAGDRAFVDPATMDELYSNDAVLLDGIADKQGGFYEVEVELPDVSCDGCTLQLIQVMYDKPPFGDGNDMYYQCADVAIEGGEIESTGEPTTGEPTTSDPTTGDPTTGDPTTGDPTTGDPTTSDPTTGDLLTTEGSASESDGSGDGPTAGPGDNAGASATSGETETAGGGGEAAGCACVVGGSGGASALWIGLAFGVLRRRRRTT